MTDKLFIFGLPLMVAAADTIGDTLTPGTHISIGTACGIGTVMLGACWWLATKFRGIDDKLESLDKHLRDLPCEGKGCNRRHSDE